MLKQLLYSHINTMLVSPRRWGKSSLVKMAMTELCEEHSDIRVCYIDAFSISTEAEFYRMFASKVIECASSKVERWISDAKKFLTGVVPQVVLTDQVNNFMAFDIKYVPQDRDKLTILQLPEMLAKDKNIQIIVCIDEFQQLALLPEYKDMEGKMRTAWQQQEHVSYCLYGSKRHMMMNIFNNANSPFYRFGQVIFMQKIKKEDWIPFILSAFERTGKHISEAFAERVCDIVKCHSWYLQQLCYFIWSYTVDDVDEEIFSRALQQVININTPMFQNDTDNLSPSQKEMLRAVCDGVVQLSSETAKSRYSLGNPNTIVRNKRALQERDIIEKTADGLTFVDPVYELWYKSEQM